MKKRILTLVLVFSLGLTMAACGNSGRRNTEADEVQDQEEQKAGSEAGDTDTEDVSSKDNDPKEAKSDEDLNEFGISDVQMDTLMVKFRENMQENPGDYLKWEINESYEDVCTGFKTFEEAVQSEGNGPVNGLMMGLAAGEEDLEEFFPTVLDLVGSDGMSHHIQDSLVTAIAEWKEEQGIEGEKFNAFCKAMLTDYDTMQSGYMAPVYNEMIESAEFQAALEQAQALAQ